MSLSAVATTSGSCATAPAAPAAVLSPAAEQNQQAVGEAKPIASFRPFVVYYISLLFCLIVFGVGSFRALAQRDSGLHPVIIAAWCAAVLLAVKLFRVWKSTTWAEDGFIFIGSRGRLRTKSIIMALTCVFVAALVGYVIGKSGVELKELKADLQETRELGSSISTARNEAAETLEAQVEMYEAIAPDVDRLESVLNRLHSDWISYRSRFPSQMSDVNQRLAEVETDLARMGLLKKQIGVAREMREHPLTQPDLWRERMVPLLKEEETLDTPVK